MVRAFSSHAGSCRPPRADLRGVLSGNGNYAERILGAPILHAAPELEGVDGGDLDAHPVDRPNLVERLDDVNEPDVCDDVAHSDSPFGPSRWTPQS